MLLNKLLDMKTLKHEALLQHEATWLGISFLEYSFNM